MVDDRVERLGDEIAELSAHLYAATARLMGLIGEFDAQRGHEALGIASCAQWLSWRCGVSRVAAQEQVRVARALRGLPLVAQAFSRGELSYSKVRAITRIGHESNEEVLLEWARHGTAAQLERIVGGYRRAARLNSPDQRHKRRAVTWSYDDEGCLVIRARLAPEEGAVVVAAINAAVADLEREERDEPADAEAHVEGSPSSAEGAGLPPDPVWSVGADGLIDFEASPPRAQRAADALVAISETYLSHGLSRLDGHARSVVMIHADSSTLRGADPSILHGAGPSTSLGAASERSELPDHSSVHPETLRRVACDAGVVRLDPGTMSVGRRTRVVPAGMRRALTLRDRGCRFPACSNRRVDAHHIRHWARGGATALDNLVLLCRRHHRIVHEGGFSIALARAGEVQVRRPGGETLPHTPRLVSTLGPSGIARENRRSGLRIDAMTPATLGDGTKPDYGVAVWGLFALDRGGDRAATG